MKFTTKVAHFVDYGDLEAKILETYGHEYEIPCMEEVGHCSKEYDIDKEPLDEYDIEAVDLLRQGKPKHYTLRVIMQDMVNNDVIPEGNWVVDINW